MKWFLFCFGAALAADTYDAHNKIVFAMDRRDRLNPADHLKNTHRLFDVKYIESPSDFSTDFDLVAFANWSSVHGMYKQSNVKVPAFVDNELSIMELFEDKAKWKAWMNDIGLGAYVPLTYNQSASVSPTEYPIMLKTNQHFGHGVYAIANKEQLDEVAANVTSQGLSFILEEALTGTELSEFAAFGSVFKGKLLSLRYTSRSFEAGAAKLATNITDGASVTPKAGVFVRGHLLKNKEEHNIPCSLEIVKVLTTMFRKTATYTGPFCTNLKLDKHMKPKMMEVNARFCGTLYGNDFLFVTTFVPLAYAVHDYTRYIPKFHRSAFQDSENKDELWHIVGDERHALDTGGGLYKKTWLTCDKFNASARLDSTTSAHSHYKAPAPSQKLDNHHHKPSSHKVASKIVFGVDFHEGLNPGPSLHSTKSLFDYRILKLPADLTADIDIITHANYTALMELVTQVNATALPGYLPNEQATLDIFNDKGRWKAWMTEIGLGAYVPHTYDQSKDINTYDYPLMLKTNQHFGHGVYVINSAEHLQNVSTKVKQSGYAYTLEEALTGMGLSEVGTYGSAYKGQLLSLRCVIRTFTAEQTVRTGDPTKSKKGAVRSANTTADVFVRGFMMKSGEEAVLPCSTEITRATRKMLAKTSYSGAFCSSLKSDKLYRPKMLEINARFCGPMAVTDALFISTFVPLSVAHHLDLYAKDKKIASSPTAKAVSWYKSSRIYAHIADVEKKVLDTGGGMVKGKMKTVERFDPTLRVQQIGYEPIDGFRVPHLYHNSK